MMGRKINRGKQMEREEDKGEELCVVGEEGHPTA